MLLLLLNLLQQGRLSLAVIIGAVLLFIAGVSLLVYFYRKYQRIEKEPEEDWDQSRHSLFVNAPSSPKSADAGVTAAAPAAEIETTQAGETRELVSPSQLQTPAAPATEQPRVEATPRIEQVEVVKPEPAPPVVAPAEDRFTQVLASPPAGQSIEKKPADAEHPVFDDDVWADLEAQEKAREEGSETIPRHAVTEPLSAARVDERSHREPFESPRIERVRHRESFEPPTIEPLTPREQAAATRDLSAAAHTPPASVPERSERDTMIFGAKPSEPPRPLAAEAVIAGSGRMADTSEWNAQSSRSYKAPAGSVLGIPAEASRGPLILGEPVRREAGVDALTNYGKDMSPKAGRGGTIVLLIVVAVLGGALLVYLFVPSVHTQANAFIARVRGIGPQVDTRERAQIIPSYRPEVDKNMVTARGAIDNISDEPLENLEVEISLMRGGDAPPEVRKIAVTPNPLAPNQRGAFEFQYDGKRDTGFVGYKITKLYSNGNEVRFRTPNSK